jgi:hypothetical protein
MKGLPLSLSNAGPLPDLGEGFPHIIKEIIEDGEAALTDLRENTVGRWYAVGAACFALRNVALNRSGANAPAGGRYNREYSTLTHLWPQLGKLDKATRSHAIWLYQNYEHVNAWLSTLPQNMRDLWVHPRTVRKHYEKRHPHQEPDKPSKFKPHPRGKRRTWDAEPIGERTVEELKAMVRDLNEMVADRETEIAGLSLLVEQRDREIRQLRNHLAWEIAARKALEKVATPPAAATVVRPNGETVEIVHATARASQEIVPEMKYGQPDFVGWAKQIRERGTKLSVVELNWLLADNSEYFDAYERAFTGAGVGLEDWINDRVRQLENPINPHQEDTNGTAH